MNEDLLRELHQKLGGDKVGSYDSFKQAFLSDDSLRRSIHEKLGGSKVGSYESFLTDGFGLKIKSPTSKTPETQPQLPPALQADMTMVAKRRSELEASKIDYSTQQPKTASISPEGVYMGSTPDTPKIKYNVDDVLNKEFAYLGRKYNPRDLDIVMHGIDKVNKKEQSIKEAKDLTSKYDYVKIPTYNLFSLPRTVSKQDVETAMNTAKADGSLLSVKTPMLLNLGEKAFASEIKEARLDINRVNQSSDLLRKRYDFLDSKLADKFGTAWDLFQTWGKYSSDVEKGGKRNLEYEKLVTPVIQSLNDKNSPEGTIFQELLATSNKLQENKNYLHTIPSLYKNFATLEKLKQDYATDLDKKYQDTPALGRYLYNLNDILLGGIERNVNRLYKTIDVLGALVGVDRSQANVEEGSEATTTIFGNRVSAFNRPPSETIGTVHTNGIDYDVAFDKKGNILSVYDKEGFRLNLTEEGLTLISAKASEQQTFKDSKTERNWGSTLMNSADGVVDLAAQVALAKGIGTINTAVGIGTGGARVLEMTSVFPQFFGESVMTALREGELTLGEAMLSGFGDTTVEMLTEGIFPVAGRIASPVKRVTKLGKGIAIDEIKAAIGNATSKYAAKRALIDYGLGVVMEPSEEVGGNFGTYFIHKLTNDYLDGSYDDVHLPTLQENYDTALITAGTMLFSGIFSAPASYNNIKSDDYAKYTFLKTIKADDVLIDKALAAALTSNKISQEEADTFRAVHTRAKKFYEGLETISSDKKTLPLREDIITLWGLKEATELKKTGDETSDKIIQAKIDALQKEISVKTLKLQALAETSSGAAENEPDVIDTNQGVGGTGESASNFKAYDFDGTLFDGNKLTPLGEEVKDRIANGEDIRIVTARNPEDTQQIQDALGISADKISAVSVEQNKAATLDKLGINPEEYYDADKAKLDAIQGKTNPVSEVIPEVTPTETKEAPPVVEQTATDIGSKKAPDVSVSENPALKDVESTAKALETESKNNPTIWEQVKQFVKGAVKKVGNKLGIVSNEQHISNFEKAKQEWDKLSPRDKKLKRADYELDDLHHTEGGYYKVGNSLIDLDLNTNHLKLLLENNKFLNILNKLGVTKIHGENRPAEEMFAHYSDSKIHLNNNSAFENIRQVTNAMSHELGHHEWTKLTKEEMDYVRSLPIETGMAKHYEAQEKNEGKQTSASLQEENFADYVMQYFQGKLYGDETLLNKIPTKLRELFDNKYSDLLKNNEHTDVSEAYHKAKKDGSNPELVKAVEELLTQNQSESNTNQPNINENKEIQNKEQTTTQTKKEENNPFNLDLTNKSHNDIVREIITKLELNNEIIYQDENGKEC